MALYKIKAQGYGGSGASAMPFTSHDITALQSEIEDLLLSDHAVQLYKMNADDTETRVDYETYTRIRVIIDEDQ